MSTHPMSSNETSVSAIPKMDLLTTSSSNNKDDNEQWIFSIHPRLEPHQRRSLRNLMRGGGGTTTTSTTAPSVTHHDPNHDICWSFGKKQDNDMHSWYITSSSLLEVIYKPRNESLPFYTNTTKGFTGKMTNIATCGGRIGGYKSKQKENYFANNVASSSGTQVLKYSGLQKEIYTQNDVVNIEHIDDIDIMTTTKNHTYNNANIPSLVKTKWKGVKIYLKAHERHLTGTAHTGNARATAGGTSQGGNYSRNSSSNSNSSNEGGVELQQHTTKQPSTQTPLLHSRGKHDSDAKQQQTHITYSGSTDEYSSDNAEDDVIILTFALPHWTEKEDESLVSFAKEEGAIGDSSSGVTPPLLWKVDFPLHTSISLEHLTVLNGGIHYSSKVPEAAATTATPGGGVRTRKRSPTHVYINGWQSWSFTGSVARGDPQPGSAMPDYLSKAFNHGGTIPHKVSPHKTWIKESKASNNLVPLGLKTLLHHSPQYYKSDMFTALSYNNTFSTPREDEMLDQNNTLCIVLGWISQRKQYGTIGISDDLNKISMHCTCDGIVSNIITPLPTKQFVIAKKASSSAVAEAADDDSYATKIQQSNEYQYYTKRTRIETDWAWCQILQKEDQAELHQKDDDDDPMCDYIDFTAFYNKARHHLREPLSTGWCSWYHYYENLDETTLIENFNTLEQLSKRDGGGMTFNMCMCDDGYMTSWGDWAKIKSSDKFPSQHEAMSKIANGMTKRGMRPGVWLAPFSADKGSVLATNHPEWIIRNMSGIISNSSNCGKFFYGLDASNPYVLQHAYKTIQKATTDWGYKVLKLDFLYSSCLEGNGKYNLSMTRAETMTLALKTLRDAAGDDIFIIGCGCPIGSGIGYVDGMRVSADTGPKWDPYFPLPWWDHGTLPCVRNMIRNSITRISFSHRWWHNDPDCLLLGKTTNLTNDEIISAASIIAMSGGMLLLSDDLPSLTQDRYDIATRIYPICNGVAQTLDLLTSYGSMPSLLRLYCSDDTSSTTNDPSSVGSSSEHKTGWNRSCIHVSKGLGTWTILSLSNWLEVSAMVAAPFETAVVPPKKHLQRGEKNSSLSNNTTKRVLGYHVFAFWSLKYVFVPCDEQSGHPSITSLSKRLRSHETELFHVKPVVDVAIPQYIGSSLHYTCGHEIKSIVFEDNNSKFLLYVRQGMIRTGCTIFIYIPCSSRSTVNENTEIVCTYTKKKLGSATSTTRNLTYDIVATPSFGSSTGTSDGSTSSGVLIKIHLNMTLADVTSPIAPPAASTKDAAKNDNTNAINSTNEDEENLIAITF